MCWFQNFPIFFLNQPTKLTWSDRRTKPLHACARLRNRPKQPVVLYLSVAWVQYREITPTLEFAAPYKEMTWIVIGTLHIFSETVHRKFIKRVPPCFVLTQVTVGKKGNCENVYAESYHRYRDILAGNCGDNPESGSYCKLVIFACHWFALKKKYLFNKSKRSLWAPRSFAILFGLQQLNYCRMSSTCTFLVA